MESPKEQNGFTALRLSKIFRTAFAAMLIAYLGQIDEAAAKVTGAQYEEMDKASRELQERAKIRRDWSRLYNAHRSAKTAAEKQQAAEELAKLERKYSKSAFVWRSLVKEFEDQFDFDIQKERMRARHLGSLLKDFFTYFDEIVAERNAKNVAKELSAIDASLVNDSGWLEKREKLIDDQMEIFMLFSELSMYFGKDLSDFLQKAKLTDYAEIQDIADYTIANPNRPSYEREIGKSLITLLEEFFALTETQRKSVLLHMYFNVELLKQERVAQ